MGCVLGDLTESGRTDLTVYYWGRSPVAFLRRATPAGGGTGELSAASFVPRELVPSVPRWFSNTATMADLDGDGHVDLVVGNYFADGSRILDSTAGGTESMASSLARADNGGGVHILRWEGARRGAEPDVSFGEVRGALPDRALHGWTLAAGAADLTGDLLPDLYLADDFGPDRLLVNRSTPGHLAFGLAEGVKGFATPNSKVVGRDSFKGMGVDFGDLGQRGLLDMFVSNITSPYALEESNFAYMNTGDSGSLRRGVAPFVDRSEEMGLARSGWSWDVKLGDFDNSGRLEVLQAVGFLTGHVNRWPELQELAMANQALLRDPAIWPRFRPGDDLSGHEPNRFYVRAESGRYSDFGAALGFDQHAASRSIALADVEHDGRLDVAVADQWAPSYLFHNESPNPGRFLGLDLRLPAAGAATPTTEVLDRQPAGVASRPAIGAEVMVTYPDGRRFTSQVDGGNGHGGRRSPEVQVGLGDVPANRAVQVELRWRDTQGLARGQVLHVLPGWHTVMLASGQGV
jgi:hypothetical protein